MAKKREAEVSISRLCESIYQSRLVLKRYREEMREMVRQSVGMHWSDEGTTQSVPLNLISTYQSIVGRKLVPQNPRVMLSTWNSQNRPAVKAMESWCNKELENMNFAETLERVVIGSLYSVGITKVGLATPADAGHQNWKMGVGEPYADEVLLDDFVFDVHAKSFEEAGYLGHRYRVPIDLVKDSKIYNKSRLRLEPMEDPFYNKEGDERIGVLGRSFYSNREEYEDFVDLWEIYLPRYRQIIILPDEFMAGPTDSYSEPLKVMDWVGPDCGPYHILGMGVVPGNAMPTAPMQNLLDLHLSVNNIMRKLIRQAQRQKEVLPIRDGGTEDGSRIVNVNDGEVFRCDNEAPKQIMFGGPNPQIFELMMKFQELFSWSAGNLDLLGGLSPQSKTLGQDKLLAENSSSILAAMQDKTITHARKVIKSLCWYWWNHPTKVMETVYNLPGLPEYAIGRKLYPQNHPDPTKLRRTGRLCDMEIQVDPYSMQAQTPASQMAMLDQVVTQIIVPLAPVLQAQGIIPDLNFYLKLKAQLMNLPDLPQIVGVTEPVQQEGGGGGEAAGKPAQTERTYTRVSQGNETTGNKNAESSQRMQGTMSPNERNGTMNR